MKRCIACGKENNEENTICEVCGVELDAVPEDAALETEEAAREPEPERIPTPPRRARRRSGPQIYGMENVDFEEAQGAIRRDVHAGERAAVRTDVGEHKERNPERPARTVPQPKPVKKVRMEEAEQQEEQPNPPIVPVPQKEEPAEAPVEAGRPEKKAKNSLDEVAKRCLHSPLFFLITLLHTAYVGSSIVAIFLRQLNYSQPVRLLSALSMPTQLSGYVSMLLKVLMKLDAGMIAANLGIRIPDVLFCLGLWMIWLGSGKRKETRGGAGFVFVRVVLALRMLCACLVMLAILILSVTLVIASFSAKATSMLVVSGVLLVVAIVVTMAVIMYYFCYFASVKTVLVNVKRGEADGLVSGYVAFLQLVIALTAVINILSGLVNNEMMSLVYGAAEVGWRVFLCIWLLAYRRITRKYEDRT